MAATGDRDGAAADALDEALGAPAPEDLRYSGPGDGDEDDPERQLETAELPGGLDPNVAAYGGGGGGVFLMAITARLRRRRAKRELEAREQEQDPERERRR